MLVLMGSLDRVSFSGSLGGNNKVRGQRREPGDYCIGQIPRNLWAPGDARISPLQHTSMTSHPKWEELVRDGCCRVFFCC